MDLLKQIEQWKEQIRVLQEERAQYIRDAWHGTDGDGDLVEWEEKDPYILELDERIETLQNEVDNAEDYLKEKYEETY